LAELNANETKAIMSHMIPKLIDQQNFKNKEIVRNLIRKAKFDRNTVKSKDLYYQMYGDNIFYNHSRVSRLAACTVKEVVVESKPTSINEEEDIDNTIEKIQKVLDANQTQTKLDSIHLNIIEEIQGNKEKDPNQDEDGMTENSKEIKDPFEDYISFGPNDIPLRSTGNLIEFQDFKHFLKHFNIFFQEAVKQIKLALVIGFDISHSIELHEYIKTVLNRMLKEDVNESWIPHINTFLEQNNTILIKVKEHQQNANDAFEASREWKSILESFENSKIGTEIPKSNSKHDVDEPGGFPPFDSDSNQSNKDHEQPMSPKVKSNDDPDDDSSSSSSSSSSDDSDYSDHRKQKKKTRTKKHKDNDDPKRKAKKEDKKYREIVKNLMRTAKTFDI
jgi:hypothetical protein